MHKHHRHMHFKHHPKMVDDKAREKILAFFTDLDKDIKYLLKKKK